MSRGIACEFCSDGKSYPNKFIFHTLKCFEDQFEILKSEYHPKWLKYQIDGEQKTGRYDIYFKFKNDSKKYIVEMDGGLGHGNKVFNDNNNEKKRKLQIEEDRKKQELAESKGYKVIRINSDYKKLNKRYSIIKKNIIESELSEMFDFSKVDFDAIDKASQTSDLVRCCKLYKEGIPFREIQAELEIKAQSTIQSYLRIGTRIGLCNYIPGEEFKRVHSHPVICKNTNQCFGSIKEAAAFYNMDVSLISRNCRKIYEYGGKDEKGNKLYWEYLD